MNKVCLIGRLTKDPEVRYTQTNNTLVTNFTVAVNRRFANQNGEREVDFISIVAWNKTGELCSKYFKKGQQIGIVGRINWDDDQGVKHYATEVVAEEVYFTGTKQNDNTQKDSIFGELPSDNDFDVQADDDLPF